MKDIFSFKGKITDDSEPITFKSHPRNTVLGASLLLEAFFPDITTQELNRVAPLLADEFNEVINYKHETINSYGNAIVGD